MSQQVLQVMDVKEGHKDMRYDPDDPEQVQKMVNFIREKQDQGFYLYSVDADGNYHVIRKIKDIDNSKLKEFILTREMTKKMVSTPITGG